MAGFDFKTQAKMNRRKSQVTMLMIVGLVLFIVVTFVLYLSKSAIKKQSQQNIKKTQELSIDAQPVKEYAVKCVDKLAKDAVVLLGKQGGAIYENQGGTAKFQDTDEGVFFVKYNDLRVAANIFPQRTPPPDYPSEAFPYPRKSSNSENYEEYFGEDRMPNLDTIKYQMESFIGNNLQSCLNFNYFKEQGYEVTMEKGKIDISMGDLDITVKSKIPIRIQNIATKETSELNDFSTKLNIRLNDVYYFVKNLIGRDVTDAQFNMSGIQNNKESLRINIIKGIFSDFDMKIKDDLVIVTDEKSLIYGRPLEYIFARRNRIPALHFIRPNFCKFPSGYLINETDLLGGKSLKAYDPDEDDYSFDIYLGEFGNTKAQFPKKLDLDQIKFRVEVSDGMASDYQIITINRTQSGDIRCYTV